MTPALEFYLELLSRLRSQCVLRKDIREAPGLGHGISAMLIRWAKISGHVVERQDRARPDQVRYHLRLTAIDGEDGTLWDLVKARA